MDIVGKIIQVLPMQQGTSQRTGNPWSLQSYVLETIESYPKKVCFEVFGEDRIKANPCNIDDVVTVSFDLESREFNGRWYTSVRAWKIQQGIVTNNTTQPQPVVSTAPPTPVAQTTPMGGGGNVQTFDNAGAAAVEDDGTDLPF